MEIIGHQKIRNFLDRSMEKKSIANAYLFSGSEHLGKFTLALEFAKKIVGGAEQKVNPDIIVISPEIEEKKGVVKKKDIKVEKIRELEHQLGLSSYFSKHRVAIIDDADRLTISSQNALLKTLEEPSEGCILILVCHNQEKILPTIKSRCSIKKFGLVSEEEISEFLDEKEKQKDILFWSFGRPGIAVSLQQEEGELEKKKEIRKEFEEILDANLSDKFALAENLAKDSENLLDRFGLWTMLLRKRMLSEETLLQITSQKALRLIEEIEKSTKLIRETNSNLRVILESLFLKF